jgi:hypothetical protein
MISVSAESDLRGLDPTSFQLTDISAMFLCKYVYSSPLIRATKLRRIRWVGHVEMKSIHEILV